MQTLTLFVWKTFGYLNVFIWCPDVVVLTHLSSCSHSGVPISLIVPCRNNSTYLLVFGIR